MKKKDNPLLGLNALLTQELIARIQGGAATAAELNVARQFLRDNNVMSLPEHNPNFATLMNVVPFKDDTEPPTRPEEPGVPDLEAPPPSRPDAATI